MTGDSDRDRGRLWLQPARAWLTGAALVCAYGVLWPAAQGVARRCHRFVSSPEVIA